MMQLFLTVMMLGISVMPTHAGELINSHLPANLKMDVQLRYRLESKNNFDFNDIRDDKDTYHLLRTRVGINYAPIKQLEVYSQLQDAKVFNIEDYSETPLVHYMDIRQLYFSLNDVIKAQDLYPHNKFTFGRQSLQFGAGRLVGDPLWSNIGQTFDAGRLGLSWDDPKIKIDFFAGHLTANKSPREGNDFFDRSTKDFMSGYYAAWAIDTKLTIEQYVIARRTNKNISFGPLASAKLDETTIGGRIIAKELNGFDYEIELAGQWGDFNDKNIEAWMAVALVGYTFNAPWKPRLGFEFDYASGDADPTDGTRRTFDNLYPGNHAFYGYMDLFGLQNLNDYRISLSMKPSEKLKVTADLHVIYLDTIKDSLYSASRSVSRTSTARGGSSHVGNELDIWSSYKICSYATLDLGYSHFFAGQYLAQSGANKDADFVYSQVTFNF